MNLKKILLSSVAAVTLTSVAAFAAGANDGSNAVVVANDGTGDYLVYPAYFANSAGWSTNIKVVNSNTTAAVVAKVVIRESVLSNEKLDFPIYLTPGDVWEGTLSNVGGNVVLTSSDDSMYVSGSGATSVFANTSTVVKALASTVAPENPTMGYVEVFGIAAIPGSELVAGWTSGPIAKYLLRDAFVDDLNLAPALSTATVLADWTAVDANSLYGQAVISANNGSGNLAMTIPATALENVTGTGPVTGQVIAVDTTLENSSNIAGATLLPLIETAIGKSNVYVTHYENADSTAMADTVLLLNQPMKKYRTPVTTGVVMDELATVLGYDRVAVNTSARTGTNDYSGAVITTGMTALNNYAFEYVATPRDQSENTPTVTPDQWSGFHTTSTTTRCNTELCYLDVRASGMSEYVKGWVNVNVVQATPTHNLPVIPSVMTAKSVGGTNVTNIIYPAYK